MHHFSFQLVRRLGRELRSPGTVAQPDRRGREALSQSGGSTAGASRARAGNDCPTIPCSGAESQRRTPNPTGNAGVDQRADETGSGLGTARRETQGSGIGTTEVPRPAGGEGSCPVKATTRAGRRVARRNPEQ